MSIAELTLLLVAGKDASVIPAFEFLSLSQECLSRHCLQPSPDVRYKQDWTGLNSGIQCAGRAL